MPSPYDTAAQAVGAPPRAAPSPNAPQPAASPSPSQSQPSQSHAASATYAALDLGTNNCRLLIAKPTRDGFRIIDAFSRIVRLGEGVSHTGRLSEAAMQRTLGALEVCRTKLEARHVTRARLIATEACRMAQNGPAFVARVAEATGLQLEIVDRETEAELAAGGCASLADPQAESIVLFDIGGGSSEIVWLDQAGQPPRALKERIKAWASLALGVVTLAEKFGGHEVSDATFEAMVAHVSEALAPFAVQAAAAPRAHQFHLLGTSGTVTTLAGVHLGLARYDRRRVDGLWMQTEDVVHAVKGLRAMTYDQRADNGCIGPERADLVLAGCAILEAIRLAFPAPRVRIADRGLREGILMQMMAADQVWQTQVWPTGAPRDPT